MIGLRSKKIIFLPGGEIKIANIANYRRLPPHTTALCKILSSHCGKYFLFCLLRLCIVLLLLWVFQNILSKVVSLIGKVFAFPQLTLCLAAISAQMGDFEIAVRLTSFKFLRNFERLLTEGILCRAEIRKSAHLSHAHSRSFCNRLDQRKGTSLDLETQKERWSPSNDVIKHVPRWNELE